MSLDIKAKFITLDLDKGRFSTKLREAILRQMRQAARAYVRVAAVATPFRTGFARGIFRNILEAAGGSGGNLERDIPAASHPNNFNPLNSLRILKKHGNKFVRVDKFPNVAGIFRLDKRGLRKAGATGPLEYYRSGTAKVLKTPQSGRAFATPPNNIIKSEGFTFTFNFSTTISYFQINDTKVNPRNRGTPWGAFRKGRVFMLQYLKTIGFKRLPEVNNFIFSTEINVNGENVQRTEAGVLNRNRTSTRIEE